MLQTLEKLGLFLACVGVSICLYLLYVSMAGSEIVCGLTNCGVVNNSEYSRLFGLPLTVWGLGFYLSVIGLILLRKRRLFFAISIVGVLFSMYLTYLEAFVINAWCQWCILSAWISVSIFIIAFRLKDLSPEVIKADDKQ